MPLRLVIMLCVFSLTSLLNATPTLQELETKALAGDPWAQLNLGAAYDNGVLGLTKNPKLAVSWYRKAAMQGLAEAEFNLAHSLATGHGTNPDNIEARIWMEKAAKQKLPDAQFLLGIMYKEGIGGVTDLAKSQYWFLRAAKNGQTDAQDLLK